MHSLTAEKNGPICGIRRVDLMDAYAPCRYRAAACAKQPILRQCGAEPSQSYERSRYHTTQREDDACIGHTSHACHADAPALSPCTFIVKPCAVVMQAPNYIRWSTLMQEGTLFQFVGRADENPKIQIALKELKKNTGTTVTIKLDFFEVVHLP